MKNELSIFEHREHAVVSSRIVAERFVKRHDHILRDIRELIRGIPTSGDTHRKYFIRSEYTDPQNGQRYPEYLCTKDGFSLLVMGFTGQRSLEWKLKYISAFNAMESFIRERQSSEWLITRKQGKLVRRAETDTLANLIDYAKSQGSRNAEKIYTVYSKLVNSLVGIEGGKRDSAPFKTLSAIMFLEDMILHTVDNEIQNGTHYKQIYQICKDAGEQFMRFAYLPKLTA